MSRSTAIIRGAAGIFCLVLLLTSCLPVAQPGQGQGASQPGPTATPFLTATPAPILPLPKTLNESPSLNVLTRSNLLPPLKKRLPDHPKVVRPVEKVGVYGGTWRMAILPSIDSAQFIRTVAYEPLVRWTSDWSTVEPNLVETYSINPTATEYTFTLRHGLRWSDGQPFTTEDIRFWYQDVLLNPQLTPIIPSWLKPRSEVAKFEFIDEVTFKVHFANPNSLFLQQLAAPDALVITAFPAHYIKQFHAKYASAFDIEKMLMDGGYSSWADMFIKKVGVNPLDIGNYSDPERPRLSAWVLKSPYKADAVTVAWNRNPYYWKVDIKGNQLPYIDSVYFTVVKNTDAVINRTVEGAVDMQNLSALGIDVATTFDKAEIDRYNFYRLKVGSNNLMSIEFNLAHPDSNKRSIFTNKNFRIGLSYAINRQEILAMFYGGKGQAWQSAPQADSVFYDPVMAAQYTEYSVQKANQYLDKAGFAKDPLGNRLGPGGLPISFTIEVLENEPLQIAMVNLISKYWKEVGIDVRPKIEPLPIFKATVQSNLHDAVAWRAGGTYFWDVLLDPSSYIPCNSNAFWAIPWADWYNHISGVENTKPEKDALTSLERFDSLRGVTNPVEQIRLMKSALKIAQNNFWTIGVALGPQTYGVVRADFHNVPAEMPSGWVYPDPAPTNPEQYFIGP